jgi:hypothetical protein
MTRADAEFWASAPRCWRFGLRVRDYRELEAGIRYPTFETWDRICKLYGRPQTFVS